ncbi:serine protease 7-like isoform X2 [Diabrotica virgifera virgifera]|nr:serine protease 7-like isoform X2 [Diabrotica virgifera virgifera]
MPLLRRLFGGVETFLKEHPWMVLLGYKTRSGRFKWSCGGTLISQRYVLTAAHCVTGEIEHVVGKLTYVKLGSHDRTKEISCDITGACNQKTVITGIESLSFHENYNANDKTSGNDIAVIRLNQTVEYSTYIRPICLPEPYEESHTDDPLTTVGWGLTEDGTYSKVKLKIELPLRTRDYCMDAFKEVKLNLSDSQICAGGEYDRDTCQGDSGGPLLSLTESHKQWYQEGIISIGNADCGIEGLPGVYTKVSSFLSWIHSHVKE